MKKNVWVFGLIAGAIVSTFMGIQMWRYYKNPDLEHSMLVGYASMIVALSFVFVGIKNYRDKYNGGIITFGKAFKVGFFISLIGSTLYVITWMILYHFFLPNFMDIYSAQMLKQLQESGATAVEIAAKTEEMAYWKEMYKNPIMVVLLTYSEILIPVGLPITIISALILKRKTRKEDTVVA